MTQFNGAPVHAERYHKWLTEHDLVPGRLDEAKFVWVDVETTGLDPEVDVLLEVGLMITDKYGNVCGPPTAVYIDDTTSKRKVAINNCPEVVSAMHNVSGLWRQEDPFDLFEQPVLTPPMAAEWLCSYISDFEPLPQQLYMAGSTVGFDRFAFLQRYMPEVHDLCHYRSVDNSSIKVLCELHNPYIIRGLPVPMKKHRSLPDLVDSIHEFRFYLDNFFFIPGDTDE